MGEVFVLQEMEEVFLLLQKASIIEDVKENLYSRGVLMDSTWGTKPMCAWLSGFYLVVVKPISNELHQIRIKPIRVNANQMQITTTAI